MLGKGKKTKKPEAGPPEPPANQAEAPKPAVNQLLDLLTKNPNAEIVVSAIFLDRSLSMQKYCSPLKKEPQEIINTHIGLLKECQDGKTHFVMVVTFNEQPSVDIDLCPVSETQGLASYIPKGDTRLYSTVFRGIEKLLKQFEALSPEQQKAVRVVIGTITDGKDNQSNPEKYPQNLKAIVAKALSLGWEFLTFGIGVNAEELAQIMGMPADSDHALTYSATSASLGQIQQRFTGETAIFS